MKKKNSLIVITILIIMVMVVGSCTTSGTGTNNNSASFGNILSSMIPAALQEIDANKKAHEANKQKKLALEEQQRLKRQREKEQSLQYIQSRNQNQQRRAVAAQQNSNNGNYSDLLTSDPNKNRAIQMSVQQYGVEKTREALRQGYFNNSNISNNVRETIGITSNGIQVKLRVQETSNGLVVISYRMGGPSAQETWSPIQSFARSTNFQYDGEKSRDYRFKILCNLVGENSVTTIYFN